MSAKKLDQSVFDGLLSEYRWAVIDHCGEVFVLSGEKPELNKQKNDWHFYGRDYSLVSCKYGDATDWQNSLIERQYVPSVGCTGNPVDVPTAADIDWSRQEVPEGATHYSPETDATHALFYKDDFTKMWVVVWPSLGWQDALPVGEHERVIEIPTKPEPQVDWSKAPEGATHYAPAEGVFYACFYKDDFKQVWVCDDESEQWYSQWPSLAKGRSVIPRPEPITDTRRDPVLEMARSIEAARVAEKVKRVINFADLVFEDPVGSLAAEYEAAMPYPDGDPRYFETSDVLKTKKYPHYFKDVSAVDAIDLYHVARLYDITDPALFHAFKKIACAGKRGAKDQAQDVKEAIDALKRWQELNV